MLRIKTAYFDIFGVDDVRLVYHFYCSGLHSLKTIGSAEFIQYDRNHHFIFVLSDQACSPGIIAMDESGIRRQPV